MFFLFNRSMDHLFFSNRVNSWLTDRKERTGLKMITMGSSWNGHFRAVEMFRYSSVLSNDP